MTKQTVTLTLEVAEAAIVAELMQQSLKMAEKVSDSEEAPVDVRLGALMTLILGSKVLKKVVNALPDVGQEEGEGDDQSQELEGIHVFSL